MSAAIHIATKVVEKSDEATLAYWRAQPGGTDCTPFEDEPAAKPWIDSRNVYSLPIVNQPITLESLVQIFQ